MFSLNALREASNAGYFPALTFLRAVAVLLVLIFHLIPFTAVEGIPLVEEFVKSGYVGLDIFFIISGFVVPYAMWKGGYTLRSFPKFLAKRLVRLEPPYLASVVFVILMRYIAGQLYGWGYDFNWPQILTHIGYFNQYFGYESFVGVYWSLALELQFYILIGLIFAVLVSRFQWLSLVLLVVFGSLSYFIYFPYNWFIFQYAGMFIIGILLFLFAIGKINKYVLAITLLAAYSSVWYSCEPAVLAGAIFTTGVLLFARMKWKLTTFIGSISYSLYLIHVDVANWFQHYMQPYIQSKTLLISLAILMAFLFAWMFHRLVEVPALRWSKRISYKKTVPLQ